MSDIFKPFVTVAAIAEADGRFLMVEEAIRGRLLLNQPAGHLEEGESLVDAVVRETLEETGYRVTPTALLGVYQWRKPHNQKSILRFSFAVEVDGFEENSPLDEGIVAAHWMTLKELDNCRERLRTPLILKAFDDFLAGQRISLDRLSHFDEAAFINGVED